MGQGAETKPTKTHLSPFPKFRLGNLTTHDEFLVQRQQLRIRQQNPLPQSKFRRRVLSRQNRRPRIAHDRRRAGRRRSRRRKHSRRRGFQRGRRRRGHHRTLGGLRRRHTSHTTTAAIPTDDVGQLRLERLPLRISHVWRHRRKRKIVSRIVVDETELESDLSSTFFAAEKR